MVAINTAQVSRVTRGVQLRRAQGGFQDPGVPQNAFRGADTVSGAVESSLPRAISGVGDDMAKIALAMAEEDNETRAKEADVRIAERLRRLSMGDPEDPEGTPGYLTTKGRGSLDSFGPAETAVREALDGELANASNPALRSMIEKRGSRRVSQLLDRMTGHATEQRLVVQERTSLAREAQALADVSADWKSDPVLTDALGDVHAEVLDRAEAQGMGPEATEALRAQRQSILVKGAFDAALAGQDVTRARAIFSAHADKLEGPARTTMAQALVADEVEGAAQSLADEAFAKFGGNPAKMRKWARDTLDGKEESVTIKEINARLGELRADSRFAIAMRNANDSAVRRGLTEVAQTIADEVETQFPADADLEQRKQYIRDNFSGDTEEAALSLVDERARGRKGDSSDKANEIVVAAQDAVDAAVEAAGPDASREEVEAAISEAVDGRVREKALAIYTSTINRRRADERLTEQIAAKATVAREKQVRADAAAKKAEATALKAKTFSFLHGETDGKPNTLKQLQATDPETYSALVRHGLIGKMRREQSLVQDGRLYADSSDGETLAELRLMSDEQKAALGVEGLAEYRSNLTKAEYGQATTMVASAKAKATASPDDRTTYNLAEKEIKSFLDSTARPGAKQTKGGKVAWEAAKDHMNEWVEAQLATGKKPTVPEVRREAARITMPISVDPYGPNIFRKAEFFAGIVASAPDLTQGQRDILTVPRDAIPDELMGYIEESLAEYKVSLEDVPDDDLEELAGAIAMRDGPRARKIAQGLAE